MVQETHNPSKLIPPTVTARAEPRGRWPGAFGSRFFVALIVGLVWVGPAWWDLRFLYAMAAWDVLVMLAWFSDWRCLPRPEQLEVSRGWTHPLSQAAISSITLGIHCSVKTRLHIRLEDDLPLSLAVETSSAPFEVAQAQYGSFQRSSIRDGVPALINFEDLPNLEFTVGRQCDSRATYRVRPNERGDLSVGGVFLRYQSPLKLAERWGFADLRQTVRVYPNMDEAKRHTFYLMRSRQIELEKRLKRQRGVGRDFETLREHRDGDEFRNVCWTATARRGKLITKVYRVERSQTVLIVVDSGRLMLARVRPVSDSEISILDLTSRRRSPETKPSILGGATTVSTWESSSRFNSRKSPIIQSKLDYAISAALGVAQVALYSGDNVGLLAYGRKRQARLSPGRGTQHLRAMIESLATMQGEFVEADHARAAESLLTRQRTRSLVIWLTDLAETAATPEVIDAAARLLRQHLVLFVAIAQPELAELAARRPESEDEMYRYVAAQELIQRRELLLRRLREQGALTVELEPGRLATGIINQYLEVKERSLL